MTNDSRRLVLDGRAQTVRRAVGPVAWFVSESLALLGTPAADGSIEVRTSLRRLAESENLGRDAVSAAVNRLRAEGLLVISQARDEDGRLTSGCWTLRVPGLTVVAAEPCPADPDTATPTPADLPPRRLRRPSPSASKSPTPHNSSQQLSLLDDAPPSAQRVTSPDPKNNRRLQSITYVSGAES